MKLEQFQHHSPEDRRAKAWDELINLLQEALQERQKELTRIQSVPARPGAIDPSGEDLSYQDVLQLQIDWLEEEIRSLTSRER